MTDTTKLLLAVGAGALALGYVFMKATPPAAVTPPAGLSGGVGTQVGGLLTGLGDIVSGGRSLWDSIKGPKKTNSGDDETAKPAGVLPTLFYTRKGMTYLENTPDNMGLDRTSGRMMAPTTTVEKNRRALIGLR